MISQSRLSVRLPSFSTRKSPPSSYEAFGTKITASACNVLAVKAYGEAEFWLSGGKVVLILILYCFTFITMVGGNPQKDAYGFRHWRDPGPMNSHDNGDLGRF